MKSIEISARTIEEAIAEGLRQLQCPISDCRVEILSEGAKGLFGFFGSKPATVRMTPLTEPEGDIAADLQLDLSMSDAAAKPARRAESAQGPRQKPAAPPHPTKPPMSRQSAAKQAAEGEGDARERFRSAPMPGRMPAPRREVSSEEAREPREETPRTPVPPPEHIVLHAEDTLPGRAQHFLLELTRRMGLSVQVDVQTSEQGHMVATIYGDTLGILIGRRGETLDAIQYLTSLQVNHGETDYTRVTLDTENYRARREEALTRLAARMASRAVRTGRRVSLEPMNPYERRILHATLQETPGVTTHSEGDEPYRHVVVVPDK